MKELLREILEKVNLENLKEDDFLEMFALYLVKVNPESAIEILKHMHIDLSVRKELYRSLREKADEWNIELPVMVTEYLLKLN